MGLSTLNQMKQLAELLIDKKIKIAVAESCTGGMLAQQCTSLNGSSRWFECGFVTYSNISKISLLGVKVEILNEYGAVSSQVAEQMALGALQHSEADVSISITGIAGPGGGTQDKPVGTVYIATAVNNEVKNQTAKAKLHVFEGDRRAVREQTATAAVADLIDRMIQPVDEFRG